MNEELGIRVRKEYVGIGLGIRPDGWDGYGVTVDGDLIIGGTEYGFVDKVMIEENIERFRRLVSEGRLIQLEHDGNF